MEAIDRIATATWEKMSASFPIEKARVPIVGMAESKAAHCVESAPKHLHLWLVVHEQALQVNWHTLKFLEGARTKATARSLFPILALASRGCNLSFAIRQLVVSGMEDAARPIARSLVETVEIAIALVGSPELSEEYSDIEGAGENSFWSKRVSYGRIHPYVEKTMRSAEFRTDEIADFREYRKGLRESLSGSVHSSISSAFRSYLVPSLVEPDLLSVGPFGHHSLHSPSLLTVPIYLANWLGGVISKAAMQGPTFPILQRGRGRRKRLELLLASTYALGEIISQCDDELNPPFPG